MTKDKAVQIAERIVYKSAHDQLVEKIAKALMRASQRG